MRRCTGRQVASVRALCAAEVGGQGFSFGDWLTWVASRMPRNKAAIALANKLARTAWSILRHDTWFDARQDEALEAI